MTPLPLTLTLAVVVAAAFWLDRRFRWAAKLSATLLVIIFGAALSNLGLVPPSSAVYDVITGPVTSLAIVWMLFAVNLRDLRTAGARMLAAFGIAVAGTVAGVAVASLLMHDLIGEHAWRLGGVMTGTYSGGGINFVSVGRAVGLPPDLFAAATAADNIMTALWMGATLLLPLWLARFYPPSPVARDGGPQTTRAEREAGAAGASEAHPFFAGRRLDLVDLSILLALGLAILALADTLAAWLPAVPGILWLTTLALLLGHLPWVQRLEGAMQMGVLALHFFFAVLGVFSRVAEVLRVGVEVFWFTALVVAVHGVVVYGGGRLARLDVETTSVASQAAVGGPSSALALAAARDWPGLVLPGIVAGLAGYAVGTYVGYAMAQVLRALLAG